MNKIIVIGGGAAGMAAAIGAAERGVSVTIIEKNEKLGKKIYITGKGRCNCTNDCDLEELFENVVTNKRFLYSAFYNFSNTDMKNLLEENGCKLKTERGKRVFPVSDKASDVTFALSRALKKNNVKILLDTTVDELIVEDGRAAGVYVSTRKTKHEKMLCDKVIIATGGLSYPTTGSTGDGYEFARSCGHKITDLSPALVPFESDDSYVKELQGLALRNINARIMDGKKELYSEFGELLFTHFGVSGPVLLSASSYCTKKILKHPLKLEIDLKPALTEEQLDERILRDFDEAKNKAFKNSLNHLFPSTLVPVIIKLCRIDPDKKVNEITREERRSLLGVTKAFPVNLTKLRGYNEAIITQGGISVKEVNPSTMESKLVEGLYMAGEVLDLDAVTGGFNLQIAWSTGILAGQCAAE